MRKNVKKSGRVLALALTAFLTISLVEAGAVSSEVDAAGSDYKVDSPKITYTTRDTITFGSYWQEDTNGDNVADKNDSKQPITWQVLEEYTDGTALVLSDKILDVGVYNNTYSTWDKCSLRTWLNENFYNDAFSEDDKTAIKNVEVVTNDNSVWGTDGGDNTNDDVFLLSMDDVNNSAYGFHNNFKLRDQGRTAKVTSFVKNKGVSTKVDDTSEWWLRSPGYNNQVTVCVNSVGTVDTFGKTPNYDTGGIRPAIRVNLSSEYVESGETINVSVKSCEYDTVTLGNYNGKSITWRVLNVTGDDAFLISDKVLTEMPYNDEKTSVTWKDSTLRKWLNEDFINSSFSDAEKQMIKTTTVINNKNSVWNTDGGENTSDKIFLLSLDEIVQPQYGFPDLYCAESETRVATNADEDSIESEGTVWLLRSPGHSSDCGSCVFDTGYINYDGYVVSEPLGVRPALHINISSSDSKDDKDESGEKTTEKTTTSPSKTTQKDKKTTFKIGKKTVKNKSTVKKTASIKITDNDKIKKITLNGKKIKVKSGKKTFTLKLKSHKKKLKKKGKWNTLVVIDKNGKKTTLKFKTK